MECWGMPIWRLKDEEPWRCARCGEIYDPLVDGKEPRGFTDENEPLCDDCYDELYFEWVAEA